MNTDLDYRGARFYDSDLARFLSLDPLAMSFPGVNDYCYVAGMPIIAKDPDGRRIIIVSRDPVFRALVEKQLMIIYQTEVGRQIIDALNAEGVEDVYIKENFNFYFFNASSAKYDTNRNSMFLSKATLESGGVVPNLFNAILAHNTPSYIIFGHELYHAYLDVIFYNNNDFFQNQEARKGNKNEIHERKAMAFENYLRDTFRVSTAGFDRVRYGNIFQRRKRNEHWFRNRHGLEQNQLKETIWLQESETRDEYILKFNIRKEYMDNEEIRVIEQSHQENLRKRA